MSDPQQTTRLDDLAIKEVSGVDSPANMMGGWVVIKAEGESKKERAAEIRSQLAARAEELQLEIDEDELDALVAEATEYEARGDAFEVEGWDARLRAAAEPEEDEEDEPTKPGKPTGGGSRGKAPAPTGVDSASVQMAQTPLDKALAAHRTHVLGSEIGAERVAVIARTLRAGSPRMTQEEAIAKAVAGATGDPGGVSSVIKAVTDALVVGGVMAPGEARVAAARTVADHLHRKLAARESGGPVRREILAATAEIAADIRIGRARKGLTQDDLAEACGTSVQAVRAWESGRALPAPLHATRLAGALGGGLEMAQAISKARDLAGR